MREPKHRRDVPVRKAAVQVAPRHSSGIYRERVVVLRPPFRIRDLIQATYVGNPYRAGTR